MCEKGSVHQDREKEHKKGEQRQLWPMVTSDKRKTKANRKFAPKKIGEKKLEWVG